MGKAPAFQFYPGDWTRDLDDQDLEVEGAWIRICCRLWWSETKGQATKPMREWARILRKTEKKTREIFQILLEKGIASGSVLDNQNATIISRRMVRDSEISEIRKRVGKLGGNPALSKTQTNLDNQTSNQNVGSSSSSSSSTSKETTNCPQKEIVDLWHRVLPELPKIREWDESRQELLRARWREKSERQNLDWWERFFTYMRKCPFLMGECDPTPGHPRFCAKLPWVLKKANMLKIIDGNYEGRE